MNRTCIRERSLRVLHEAGYSEVPAREAELDSKPIAAFRSASDAVTARNANPMAEPATTGPLVSLSPDARLVLQAAAADAYAIVAELMERCGLRGKRFNRVIRELIPLTEYVELRVLHTGLRSRPPMWVRLTERGFTALGKTPVPETTRPGAQYDHNFWLVRIPRRLRRSGKYTKVLVNAAIGGKRADIAALTTEGLWEGFEAELQDAQKDLLTNVERDLTVCNLSRVTVLIAKQSQAGTAWRTLKAHLSAELFARVGIEPLGNYL